MTKRTRQQYSRRDAMNVVLPSLHAVHVFLEADLFISRLERVELQQFSSPKLWDLGCLLHDQHSWNLRDQLNRDIDHLITVSQLWNFCALLNSLDHDGDLSLRHDRGIDDLVGELQR